ncbi:MAG: hypothetical protein ABI870_02500 [Rhodanobacter sp.]
MRADTDEMLAAWEHRCRSHGLSITSSRRATLIGMLQSDAICDAAGWLLMARQRHADIRLGNVCRFLRELERCGLAEVETMVHSRCRWRLKDLAPAPPTGEL